MFVLTRVYFSWHSQGRLVCFSCIWSVFLLLCDFFCSLINMQIWKWFKWTLLVREILDISSRRFLKTVFQNLFLEIWIEIRFYLKINLKKFTVKSKKKVFKKKFSVLKAVRFWTLLSMFLFENTYKVFMNTQHLISFLRKREV